MNSAKTVQYQYPATSLSRSFYIRDVRPRSDSDILILQYLSAGGSHSTRVSSVRRKVGLERIQSIKEGLPIISLALLSTSKQERLLLNSDCIPLLLDRADMRGIEGITIKELIRTELHMNDTLVWTLTS